MDWLLPTDRLLSFEPLAAILVGVVAGLIFGLLPGINGKKGIILSLPFLVTVDPLNAAVYLVAMHAVVHTCGALPAVLLGLPTSSSEAATILDGYPMVRQGRAAEAIAATIVGSSVGGFLGALALIALIPLGILIVPFIGSPEILGLTSLGLLFVSALSGNSLARGLVVVGLGLLASSVGIDGLTGTQRYTFSEPTLAAGINIAAILAGIFVVPELVGLTDEDKKGRENSIVVSIRAVVDQLSHAARHIGVIVRSSLIGVVVGFIPGIGASVAVWMAYGHTVQTGPQQPPYGEGNVAGLIAVETANNAKEGGSFAPTLMFAVPGTSGMAIMMLAFSQIGIEVGPRLVTEDPAFISLVGWIILAANLVAVPVCLLLVPSLAFIATMRQRVISPLTLVLALAAAVVIMPHASSLLQVAVFSVVGVALKWANWPRAPMVLGLVIGPIVEATLYRTIHVFGWQAFERPGVQLLSVIFIVGMLLVFWGRDLGGARSSLRPAEPAPFLALVFLSMFAVAIVLALQFSTGAMLFPLAVSIVAFAACLVVTVQDVRRNGWHQELYASGKIEANLVLPLMGLLIVAPVVGFPMAAALYVAVSLLWSARLSFIPTLILTSAAGLTALVLGGDTIGLLQPLDPLWIWLHG
jgi:TctA family transporter